MISIFILLSTLFIIITALMVRYYLLQGLKSELLNGMVDLDYAIELLNRSTQPINTILKEYHLKSKFDIHAKKQSYYYLRESVLLTREYNLEQRRYLVKFLKRYYKVILEYGSLEELAKDKR